MFRRYWVLTKLTLTIGATGLLMLHQFGAVEVAARRVLAVAPGTLPETGRLGTELASKAALALLALLAITTLSVFKPWGLTPYGLRKRRERLSGMALAASDPDGAIAGLPLGFKVFATVIAIVIMLFGLLHHVASGSPMHQGH